jgi:ATP:ADP antiporter, AAA family
MFKKISSKIGSLWNIQEEFRLKVFYLTLTFLFMSACLAVWRPLKIAIFAKLIGSEFVPDAKLYSLFFLVPLVLFYSKLVDWLRRHQLLYCFSLFHGLGGIIFYFLLSHPIYGISNTETSPYRLTGWAFYFFMESFNAFMSTTFWSFADSVNNPDEAKNYYALFVTGSKFGSILSSGLLLLTLSFVQSIPDAVLLPNALLIGSFLLVGAAISVHLLTKTVPGYHLHGYEAVYQMEKKKSTGKQGFFKSLKSSIEGLIIIIKNPYVLGIFSLVIFYEVIIVIFDYQVLRMADITYDTAGSLTAFYALYYLLMNLVGICIAIFGTTPILKYLGSRTTLFIFPALTLIIIATCLLFPNLQIYIPFYGSVGILFSALVVLRALNYALNHPTREVLYIPTTKSIKFKAKAWTDAFGSRIAKGAGSAFNIALKKATPILAIFYSLSFSIGLVSVWLIIVYFLGKTLQKAIDNKMVIGEESQNKN